MVSFCAKGTYGFMLSVMRGKEFAPIGHESQHARKPQNPNQRAGIRFLTHKRVTREERAAQFILCGRLIKQAAERLCISPEEPALSLSNGGRLSFQTCPN
jgi:hypothetical protein